MIFCIQIIHLDNNFDYLCHKLCRKERRKSSLLLEVLDEIESLNSFDSKLLEAVANTIGVNGSVAESICDSAGGGVAKSEGGTLPGGISAVLKYGWRRCAGVSLGDSLGGSFDDGVGGSFDDSVGGSFHDRVGGSFDDGVVGSFDDGVGGSCDGVDVSVGKTVSFNLQVGNLSEIILTMDCTGNEVNHHSTPLNISKKRLDWKHK